MHIRIAVEHHGAILRKPFWGICSENSRSLTRLEALQTRSLTSDSAVFPFFGYDFFWATEQVPYRPAAAALVEASMVAFLDRH